MAMEEWYLDITQEKSTLVINVSDETSEEKLLEQSKAIELQEYNKLIALYKTMIRLTGTSLVSMGNFAIFYFLEHINIKEESKQSILLAATITYILLIYISIEENGYDFEVNQLDKKIKWLFIPTIPYVIALVFYFLPRLL